MEVIGLHTIWKGSISFGLVNIPVRMYAATDEKQVSFRHLHRPCKTPIRYARTCPTCNKEVPWDEVVKGYEYADGRFVLMEKEELESILPDNRRTIEILDFVDLKEIDPIYFIILLFNRLGIIRLNTAERRTIESEKNTLYMSERVRKIS